MSYSIWQHIPRILSRCERRFRRLWKRKDGARHQSRKWENSIASSKNRIVFMALLPVRHLMSKIQMTNPKHSTFLQSRLEDWWWITFLSLMVLSFREGRLSPSLVMQSITIRWLLQWSLSVLSMNTQGISKRYYENPQEFQGFRFADKDPLKWQLTSINPEYMLFGYGRPSWWVSIFWLGIGSIISNPSLSFFSN